MSSEPTVRALVEAVSHQQPNACDLIHEVARKDPGIPALVDRQTGLTLTFGELSTRIAKTASRLQAIGLRPRDRVALFVADGPRFVILVNALFHLGAVPVLYNARFTAREIAPVTADAGVRVIVTSDLTAEHTDYAALLTQALPSPKGASGWLSCIQIFSSFRVYTLPNSRAKSQASG